MRQTMRCHAHLRDAELSIQKREAPVDADDCGSLKARRDRTVEVLLARDVDLIDDVATQHEALLDGDVDGLWIDQKGRGVIDFVGADIRCVEEIHDVLARLEFHQGGSVIFSELGQSGPHMAQNRTVVVVRVEPRRALAKHFLVGEKLLMDLEADLQPDLGVIDFTGQGVSSRSEPPDDSNEC